MSETETISQDVTTEETDLAREVREFAESAAEPEDYLVKCNSCGYQKPRSDPGGCPMDHVGGWSYAGPFPDAEGGILVEEPVVTPIEDVAEPDEEAEPEEDEVVETAEMTALVNKMFEVQDRLDAAIEEAVEKADASKFAKRRVETLQEDLSLAVRRVREARTAREPDPIRYPLLDGPKTAKEGINATFAKPEAIAPLPADTFEEHVRRMGVATRIDDLGLSPKIVEVLADADIHTIDAWARKRAAVEEAGAKVTTIRGLTEARLEKLVAAIGTAMDGWVASWNEAHPDARVESEEPEPAEEGAGDEAEATESPAE